jgi:crotonobetainyl-CoA:carnitine CoA-transferase CaiB-like acyl-CoA transferase
LDIIRDVPQGAGDMRVLDYPVRFSESRPVVRGHAPQIGEHTEAIARELGLTADFKRAWSAA